MAAETYRPAPLASGQLIRLGKPRVVALIAFTAVIGMFLAAPGLPPAGPLLFGAIGIALVANSAAGQPFARRTAPRFLGYPSGAQVALVRARTWIASTSITLESDDEYEAHVW
jgi:hypothetical protein